MFLILFLVLINLLYVRTQVLYECNFDHDLILHHCFLPTISVVSNVGNADIPVPTAPLSDVTSICMFKKPTKTRLFILTQ
jgi:hypothetical protein